MSEPTPPIELTEVLVKCPSCGGEIVSGSPRCGECGARLVAPGRSAAWVVSTITLAAVAIGLTYLLVEERRAREVAEHSATELATALSASQIREEVLTQKVDELVNSDRYAYEKLRHDTANDNLDGAQVIFEGFLKTFPESSYRAVVAADLEKVSQMIADEETRIVDALSAASEAADAAAAFEILSAANDGPYGDSRLIAAMEVYREDAERLIAERKARETIGVELEDLKATFELRGALGSKLWIPSVRFDVRNNLDQDITKLQVSAQFMDTQKNRLFGDQVTDYVIYHRASGSKLAPGVAKTVFLYGTVGFKSDWAFVGDGPSIVAEVAISRDDSEFVPLGKISVKKPY